MAHSAKGLWQNHNFNLFKLGSKPYAPSPLPFAIERSEIA